MKGKELTDYVLKKTSEASKLFNSLDKNKYTQEIPFSLEAGRARDYLHGLGNFYDFIDTGAIDENKEKGFMNDFIEHYVSTVKEEIDTDLYKNAILKLPSAKFRRMFTGAFGALLGSGIIFWPGRDYKLVAAVCAFILGTRVWEAHRLVKGCKNTIKKYESQEAEKTSIYRVDVDGLKSVLLDKREDITPLLPA